MKLSFNWLSEFVDLSGVSVEELKNKLTMGAFEVEEVTKVGSSLSPKVHGPLVVGEILEIYPHPNADKIRLTKVRVKNGEEPLEIVCGAGNIEVGQRIPVALPGAQVLNRQTGEPYTIELRPVRGVVSNGMLCSPSEIGVSTDGDGILILQHNQENPIEIGADAEQLFNQDQDWVLHVEPRSNRGDALSVVGLAREVAAILKRPLIKKDVQLPNVSQTEKKIVCKIEDESDCAFFTMRVISGLKVGPSPAAIVKRLEAIGVRSVNNIVDVTNYVMHEMGQPLHAYDFAQLSQDALIVRRAADGEKLVCIDGKERTLTPEVMVIADPRKAVGVAGVMGGKESEVTDDTTVVALEAASFSPHRVRRGSRLLGLSSDSSLRFERGVDAASVKQASDRAVQLLLQHCTAPGASAAIGELTSAGSDSVGKAHVEVRLPQIKRLLDVEMDAKQVEELLTPLGFTVAIDEVKSSQNKVVIEVPSFRQRDVSREIDIIEEVCRLWGYDNLPPTMPKSTIPAVSGDDTLKRVRQALIAQGLSEAWISSLTSESDLIGEQESRAVRVLNPLSADHQVLRQSLIPGLVKAAVYNQDRGRKDVWLFEVGRAYIRNGKSPTESDTGVDEHTRVAGFITGARCGGVPGATSQSNGGSSQRLHQQLDFYTAKGIVENLMRTIKVPLNRLRFFSSNQLPGFLHPYRSCHVALAGKEEGKKGKKESDQQSELVILGFLGEIHPRYAADNGLRQNSYVFELDVEGLKSHRAVLQFQEIASTPSVVRDLTVDIDVKVDHAAINSCIVSSAGKVLMELELVSIFQLSDDQKSLSYRLTFQSPTETLTSADVDKTIERVRNSLIRQVNAKFRA